MRSNQSEIKSIVKRRTNFEYSIKRKQPEKADFLRYIEYEINLDRLRIKRKERFGIKGKTTISDYAITRRVNYTFERALLKFKNDIALWLQYIEYAKATEAGKLLGKIFASALQLHPTKPALWILAAKWEFEDNANVVAARVLMQRGLRLNPTSIQLWHEYFKLELVYVEKITTRHKVLGISSASHDDDEQSDTEQPNTENMIKLPRLEGEYEHVSDVQVEQQARTRKDVNKVLSGELARWIYANAIKAVPNDLTFRQKFIEIYSEFPDTDESQELVYESIRRDFRSDPKALACLAERHIRSMPDLDIAESIPAIKRSVTEFQQYVQKLKNPQMWRFFVEFINRCLGKTSDTNLIKYFSKLLSKTYGSAENQGLISEELYVCWLDWEIGRADAEDGAREVEKILRRATSKYPNSERLWLRHITINEQLTDRDAESTRKLYANALENNSGSLELWTSYLSWVFSCGKDGKLSNGEIEEMLLAALGSVTTESPSDDVASIVASRYVSWVAEVDGIQKARTVYRHILGTAVSSAVFYQTCIAVENSHASSDRNEHIERLYERMLTNRRSSQDMWLAYAEFLQHTGQITKLNAVYWRAMQTLEDPTEFEKQYLNMLQANTCNNINF